MNEIHLLWSIASCALFAGVAHAQPPARATISFSAADGCPTVGRFTDEVAARVGYVPFAEDAPRQLRVEIVHTGQQFLGTAEFVGAGARVFRGDRCEQVVQDIASATAVMLDPRAQAAPPPEPAAAATPPAPPPPPSDGALRYPVSFTFETDDEDLQHVAIHRMTHTGSAVAYGSNGAAAYGTAQYFEELCAMPCRIELEPGTHRLGISADMESAVPLEDVVRVDGPTDVRFTHESASAVAYVGAALVIGGLATMALSPLLLLVDVGVTGVLATLGAGGGALIGGWIMMVAGSADLEMDVRPGNR